MAIDSGNPGIGGWVREFRKNFINKRYRGNFLKDAKYNKTFSVKEGEYISGGGNLFTIFEGGNGRNGSYILPNMGPKENLIDGFDTWERDEACQETLFAPINHMFTSQE